MNALVELIIALVDYLRAELREAKCGLFGLMAAFLLLAAAAIFLIATLGLALLAIYWGLRQNLGPAVSELLTALISLIIAGGLGWIAKIKLRR